MPKPNLFLKFLTQAFFFLLAALSIAACFYVRPQILKRNEIENSKALRKNLTAVLPKFDNEPWNESFEIDGVKIYPARREEKVSLPVDSSLPEAEPQTVMASVLTGFAFRIPASDGEGDNSVWIGLDTEGEPTGFRPGLIRPARVPENFSADIPPGSSAARNMTEAVDQAKEFFEMRRNFFFAQAHQTEIAGDAS